jgi:transglutaminase-like putative cysteine protease
MRRLSRPRRLLVVVLCVACTTGGLAGSSGSGALAQASLLEPVDPALLARPADADLAGDATSVPRDEPRSIAPTIDFAAAEAAALQVLDGMDPADWVIEDLVARLDYDPAAAFSFVRDRIGYQPYAGVLRGARGTLAARAGNALDRALLLADLLERMEVRVRFAFGRLDASSADALVTRSLTGAPDPLPAPP